MLELAKALTSTRKSRLHPPPGLRIGAAFFIAPILTSYLALTSACDDHPASAAPGYNALIQVDEAQLVNAPLRPGAQGPKVTELLFAQGILRRGEWGIHLNGRLGPGATAIHIAAQGDNQHWVVPAKGFDFTVPNELQWSADFALSHRFAGERVVIETQAADASGRLGPIRQTEFAVAPRPEAAKLIVELRWNSPVDLDLHVLSPDGRLFGPKQQSDGAMGKEHTVLYEFDSNQECHLDYRHRETVVWTQTPPSGVYRVYADLFSNCKQSAVDFEVRAYRADGSVIAAQGGSQYAFDAQLPQDPQSSAPGLWVMEFSLP